ncbi:MAG: hypothetical protein N3A72_07980 [bacterium]|nr:hypothetical protein [bacterium]
MNKNIVLCILLLLGFSFLCVTISFAGSKPVFAEYVTGGVFQQTWKKIIGDETIIPANSDTAYPAGQVFPNPSGDGWVMKVVAAPGGLGGAGAVGGNESWTDMLISANVFINIDITARHDTMIGGRMAVTTPVWGSGVRGGYYTQDFWGITVPCWATRDNYSAPNPTVPTTYTSNGWHRIILVFSGSEVKMYLDMTYPEVVNALNTGTPAPLITTSVTRTEGGVGFYSCYQASGVATGEPAYADDIEVYLPPYELPQLVLSPTTTAQVSIGQTKTFIASEGTPPYYWALSTTGIGSIDTFSGATVVFTAENAGVVNLILTDSTLPTPLKQTATITVVPTSAPLFLDRDSSYYSRKELFE